MILLYSALNYVYDYPNNALGCDVDIYIVGMLSWCLSCICISLRYLDKDTGFFIEHVRFPPFLSRHAGTDASGRPFSVAGTDGAILLVLMKTRMVMVMALTLRTFDKALKRYLF